MLPSLFTNKTEIIQWLPAAISIFTVILFSLWSSEYRKKQLRQNAEKRKAMHPPVPREILRKQPTDGDLLLGKYRGRYVCSSVDTDAHYLILGGSGSGKSSCFIIPNLLLNQKSGIFAVDIKGELSAKAARCSDSSVCIFNPQEHTTYGYNPFFLLNEHSTEQQIFETMQLTSFSLIALPADVKDPFWKTSARNLLLGLLLYFYQSGDKNFIAITDSILNKPIQMTISDAVSHTSPISIAYKYLISFSDMAEETISGIFAEVANALVPFSTDQDIRQTFGTSSHVITPQLLEEDKHIYLVIREENLTAYHSILKLILNQMLAEMEKRPEQSPPILFFIDELARILSGGKLEKLLDSVKTLRSR